jgi:DNA-binding NarL/FixJ family response regulator
MPGGPSGLELLQWIRSTNNPALQRVPVVLLTAKGLTSDRIAGYQAGADVYLSKPFYPDELLSVVDNLIARRQEMVGDAGAMLELQQDLANIQMLLQEQSRTAVIPTDVYLTPAEREVLELLCEGYTNAEIAAQRGTAQNYVIKTLQKIYRATGTSTRTELLRWAVQTGYVSPNLS